MREELRGTHLQALSPREESGARPGEREESGARPGEREERLRAWYPYIKRLYECRQADPDFMEHLRQDPDGVLQRIRVPLPPADAIRAAQRCGVWGWDENLYLSLYRDRLRVISAEVARRMDISRYADPALSRYAGIVRNRMFLFSRLLQGHQNIRYFPAAIELSSGCSVQCPFCALDAPALAGCVPYRDGYAGAAKQDGSWWTDMLETLRELLGPVADTVPCYYATEPLDHPEYERFLADYRRALGTLPQTTTAVAERDPERFRRLLALVGPEELSHAALRISVRTKKHFYRLLELYAPEELEDIELILNNPEALHYYSDAGRIRRRHHGSAGSGKEDGRVGNAKLVRYSIACVTGLLINPYERRVSFVEPEVPSDQFPTGVRTYETRSFTDPASFREAARSLLDRYTRDRIRPDDLLWFDPLTRITREGFWFLFAGDGPVCRMRVNAVTAACLEALREKPLSLKQLGAGQGLSDFILKGVKEKLDILFYKGYLRCTPAAAQ